MDNTGNLTALNSIQYSIQSTDNKIVIANIFPSVYKERWLMLSVAMLRENGNGLVLESGAGGVAAGRNVESEGIVEEGY